MNIQIRQAIKEDLPQILNLYAEVLDKGEVLSLEQAETLFSKMATYPNYKVYVAETESTIIGTFALLIMDNLAHLGTPSAVVEDVVVADNYQGKGIGKTMMIFAMEKSKETGCYKLVLSSNLKRTEAHAFYESLAFEKHGFSFRADL
ncbi:GNAT family N-acetyltransferase [Arcicella lustrica]|uniref:GNAT family N-acetyltransferase n=1 Tax=Arcicella lustrica TaxID=2984196 RepID=A0ABU5SIU4_9BACT|nr:GNAT family N-acetyltransferase [Arcicella sp. DC25W]MEA5427193.1 GNAT family N-acetyltransferase [Arcicella sp. DC25W]